MPADILRIDGNIAVVQMPQRRFPAIAFQGDTLKSLVEEVRRAAERHDPERKDEDLNAVIRDFDAALALYAAYVQSQGLRLPW